MIAFGIKYWFIFLLSAIIAALGIALLLYFRNRENRELGKAKIYTLSILRFLSFFFIAFLLLSPFIRNLKKIIQNPVVITAWDDSESMKATPDSSEVTKLVNDTRNEIKDGLESKYTVTEYAFGEKTEPLENLNFTEKKSDYGELISSIANTHFNENIGALIIAGDGIYNQGKNPINLLSNINFPVYTIGFGDTTEVIDSRIQNIRVNRTSFSGNRFPVEVDVQFLKLKGRPLKLSVEHENSEVASVMVTPATDNYFFTREFTLEAGDPGLKHYTVKIEPVENERNVKNNKAGFVINVLKNKQKILILSDGPHPDIGAITNTLELQTTYDVSVFTDEPYPADLSEFNLLILNQLPTAGKSASEIIKKAEASRIPILFIVGNKTFLPQFNALTQGAKITPLAVSGTGEEALATLNPIFATFSLSDNFKEMLPKFPPLIVPFADYDLDADFTPLFYQKILKVETNKPLMATGLINGRKTGFIFGEGLWRWRLYDYYVNENESAFNELINQLVQYLSLRENEDNFIIDYSSVYAEIDDIIFTAEVYNDAYERITSDEINMVIQNSNGNEYNYTFDVLGGNYQLNTGHLPVGDYTFSASVKVGNETFNETGKFTVAPVNFEDIITRANYNTLFQLAAQSGGKFYLPSNTKQLINDLKDDSRLKPTSYFQEMVRELLNLKVLFFVVLLLLSVEWFLRKFWGIY